MNAEQKELLKQLAQMGDVVLVKKDGSRIQLNDDAKTPLNTQEEAVLYFLQRMDISMVSTVLDDKFTYQDFSKSLFIKKLDNAIDEFIEAGDTYLNRYDGFCNSKTCNYKCKGYSFIGNKSKNYFDLLIEVKDGVVIDICECFSFKCKNPRIKKNEFIVLDKSDELFEDDD